MALGAYLAKEFDGPMLRCLDTELVVFSGLKTDKLDDLEAMIGRGKVRMVFTAGSLAMALKKAATELDGQQFSLGVAEDPGHADKPYFIPAKRIEQARRMVSEGREKGIEFVLPVDFILQDGRAAEVIGPGDQQLDIGPQTSELFARKVGEFIAEHKDRRAVAFHNGVFGKFEEPQFAEGTKRFVAQLSATEAGRRRGLRRRRRRRCGPGTVRQSGRRHARVHGRRHGAQCAGKRAGALSGGSQHGGPARARLAVR